MKILGAVLAGGQSSRFGSDKALARIGDETLLERVRAALARQSDAVCVVGRCHDGLTIPDWPRPGMGPLGGLAGALRYADQRSYDLVLTSALDIPDLPGDLARQLAAAPAFVADQPVVGLWRVADSPILERLLTGETRRSMRAFCKACGARAVKLEALLSNINRPSDLEDFMNRMTPRHATHRLSAV